MTWLKYKDIIYKDIIMYITFSCSKTCNKKKLMCFFWRVLEPSNGTSVISYGKIDRTYEQINLRARS